MDYSYLREYGFFKIKRYKGMRLKDLLSLFFAFGVFNLNKLI